MTYDFHIGVDYHKAYSHIEAQASAAGLATAEFVRRRGAV